LIDDHPTANLGYWIRSGETGNGLATEATLGLANFAFRELGLLRLEIIMSTQKTGSRRVALNAGAHFEGTLRNRLLLHGQCHNAYLYSLIPDMLPIE
jgi:ribosomal-protein-serine acetyltransferase